MLEYEYLRVSRFRCDESRIVIIGCAIKERMLAMLRASIRPAIILMLIPSKPSYYRNGWTRGGTEGKAGTL